MLVTVTSTAPNASTLSHLLHKHPGRAQEFALSVGTAHVFYPEASDKRCTVAMLLEVDPIGLVRNKRFRGRDSATLARYVNDRPYASSSMVAVALGQVFRTAMNGTSESFPELASSPLPLEITVAALPARGRETEGLVAQLFEPLGWQVDETSVQLDPEFPQWGASPYVDLVLRGDMRVGEALRHLYVLLPVLDDAKHYWVSEDEVGKLLRAGDGWLSDHPLRELITHRYLAHQRSMIDEAGELLGAQSRLGALDDIPALASTVAGDNPRPAPLALQRADAVVTALRDVGARTVADVGCGEGALLKRLVADPVFTAVIGADVSATALARTERTLNLREASDRQRSRVRLIQSSVTYQDDRIAGLDALILMEVVEHLDPERLPALDSSVFAAAAPQAVIVTTPNSEYNTLFDSLPAGTFRHADHRFEWSRAEFSAWAEGIGARNGYGVEYRTVGHVHPTLGAATQLALFRKVTDR